MRNGRYSGSTSLLNRSRCGGAFCYVTGNGVQLVPIRKAKTLWVLLSNVLIYMTLTRGFMMRRNGYATCSAIVLVAFIAFPASASDPAYRSYAREVRALTEQGYRQHRDTIDPQHLRGKRHGYDLDHDPISIKECWLKRMTASSCASASNLRVVPAHQNRSEGCKVSGCRLQNR